jgi:hypothetical protein
MGVRYLRETAKLVDAGRMKPILDPHHNLDSVIDAYRAIEQRRAVGKVVIDIADSEVLRRSSLR